MWQIIIIIGILHAGVFAEANSMRTCNVKECKNLMPEIEKGIGDDMFPDEERLDELCPSALAFLGCIEDKVSNCPIESLFENFADNETKAAMVSISLALNDLATDLCDKDTDLHKRYVANIECSREVFMDPLSSGMCISEARTIYDEYELASENESNDKEKECLMSSHIFACISHDVKENCGEEARSTMIEIYKRTKFMKLSCSMKDFVTLRANYLDFVGLKLHKKQIYEEAFNIRKRK